RPAAPVRFPRGARSGASRPPTGGRSPYAAHLRPVAAIERPTQRTGDDRPPRRGRPLVRSPERNVPGAPDRVLSRHQNAGGDELPPRVLRRLDAPLLLPPGLPCPARRRRRR